MLATLVAELRSFDLAEDALQDAFAAATRQWPGEGVPRRPAAWLLSVARRRAIDRRRRDQTLLRYLPLLITPEEAPPLLPTSTGDVRPIRPTSSGEARPRPPSVGDARPIRPTSVGDGRPIRSPSAEEVAATLPASNGEARPRPMSAGEVRAVRLASAGEVRAVRPASAGDARLTRSPSARGVPAKLPASNGEAPPNRPAGAQEAPPKPPASTRGAVGSGSALEPGEPGGQATDESLQLLFACCHPALALEARVALTLRFVAGLTVAEIGRLFLVSEATMAARVTRAKQKIRTAGIPLRVPAPADYPARADGVLAVIYLLFTEGYRSYRHDLAAEAIRICRLMPPAPETTALLALMLLQHSRRHARLSDSRIVLLPDQDRTRWNAREIAAGLALLEAPAPRGPYRLQALIAAQHALARHATDTDWPRIAALYAQLEDLTGSPVVRLNRAIAVAEAEGPQRGLDLLDFDLPGHHLPAARAEMLLRLGRTAEAVKQFDLALASATTDTERDHLRRRRESAPGTGTG
ncbi:hypothetical protein M1L60_35450 [Actinoplanes sp. TRM 88003]|uniref:RNA polymerase sigma factor n=1 Tax=Paractinoplanes aksuensis TaxID=2939490 RepID=A0ABT1DYK1_9ACTN|nr:hypothetical protein [Actinoplanes aksuensis]